MQFRKISLALLVAAALSIPAHACSLADILAKGSTSRSVALDIIDSTDGTPETGVVFNTSGIDLWYRREGAVRTAITEATLAALTTAYSSGGFLHVSDGAYRLDVPDAAFATGANYVDIGGAVTGMVVICQRVRLVDYSLEDAVRGTTGTALPNAAAGASGGAIINGSNTGTVTLAALTVNGTTTISDGLVVARSTSNQPAATFTGNGTGNGVTITSGAGATGTGLAIASGATNGAGATITGTGTGNGATFTSGAGATGNGISAVAASTNGNGINTAGTGTGSGELDTGGATGHGISAVGGATSGNGVRATGTAGNSVALNLIGQGSAAGLLSTGGATGAGIAATGGATSGAGLLATSTSGAGISAAGGTAGAGILATGGATGHGVSAVGGATSGDGVRAVGTAGNSNALNLVGQGSAAGLLATGGATGPGFSLVGGATSGNALATAYTLCVGSVKQFGISNCGKLQSATATTAVIDASANFTANDNILGQTIDITGGTGAGQSKSITAWNNTSKTVTVSTWGTTPDNTSQYEIWGTAASSGGSGLDAAQTRAALGFASANADAQFAAIQSDTDNLQTRLPAALVSSRMDASIGAYQSGLTPLQPTVPGRTLDVTATGEGGIDWANVGSPTTSVGLTNTTISTTQAVASVATVSDKTGYTLSAAGINAFADTSTSGHTTGGTWGGAWNAAGAAGDPWSTALPGGYASGTAGNILGNRLDAAISSRMATFTLPTNFSSLAITGGGAVTAGTVSAGAITAPSFAADAITAAKVAPDVTTELQSGLATSSSVSAVLSAIGALNNLSAAQVWDHIVEDQGSVSARCMLSAIFAYTSGDIVTVGNTTTYEESTGAETRMVITIASAGNRTTVVTCPTP